MVFPRELRYSLNGILQLKQISADLTRGMALGRIPNHRRVDLSVLGSNSWHTNHWNCKEVNGPPSTGTWEQDLCVLVRENQAPPLTVQEVTGFQPEHFVRGISLYE
jgi:hypothetical protein